MKIKITIDELDVGSGNEFCPGYYPADGLYLNRRTWNIYSVTGNRSWVNAMGLTTLPLAEEVVEKKTETPETGSMSEPGILKLIALLRSSTDVPATDILKS